MVSPQNLKVPVSIATNVKYSPDDGVGVGGTYPQSVEFLSINVPCLVSTGETVIQVEPPS